MNCVIIISVILLPFALSHFSNICKPYILNLHQTQLNLPRVCSHVVITQALKHLAKVSENSSTSSIYNSQIWQMSPAGTLLEPSSLQSHGHTSPLIESIRRKVSRFLMKRCLMVTLREVDKTEHLRFQGSNTFQYLEDIRNSAARSLILGLGLGTRCT